MTAESVKSPVFVYKEKGPSDDNKVYWDGFSAQGQQVFYLFILPVKVFYVIK